MAKILNDSPTVRYSAKGRKHVIEFVLTDEWYFDSEVYTLKMAKKADAINVLHLLDNPNLKRALSEVAAGCDPDDMDDFFNSISELYHLMDIALDVIAIKSLNN